MQCISSQLLSRKHYLCDFKCGGCPILLRSRQTPRFHKVPMTSRRLPTVPKTSRHLLTSESQLPHPRRCSTPHPTTRKLPSHPVSHTSAADNPRTPSSPHFPRFGQITFPRFPLRVEFTPPDSHRSYVSHFHIFVLLLFQ